MKPGFDSNVCYVTHRSDADVGNDDRALATWSWTEVRLRCHAVSETASRRAGSPNSYSMSFHSPSRAPARSRREPPRPHAVRKSDVEVARARGRRSAAPSPRRATRMLMRRQAPSARAAAPSASAARAPRGHGRASRRHLEDARRPPSSAISRNGEPFRPGTLSTAISFAALKHARFGPAFLPGRACEREQRERVQVGRLELEREAGGEVQPRHRRRGPLGVRQREGDRHAHVRVGRDARWRRRRGSARARGRPTSDARRRRSGRTEARRARAPRSARGPCSPASPSRS